MQDWPLRYEQSWTLAGEVRQIGVGLHSGEMCEICLIPYDKTGFYISWIGDKQEPIKLSPKQVQESPLCTTLKFGDRCLATVEHLLAALAGCGLTHVWIQVSGPEVPLLDGSALDWVNAIAEVGLSPASSISPGPLRIKKPYVCYRGSSVITAIPSENFSLVSAIDFPQAAIGRQMFSIELTPRNFVREIAPARTFGFLDQVEKLQAAGLIKGATLDNALVCNGEEWLNPTLRFRDEPVRHKLLDLVGDLALVGFPQAQVVVYRGSHALHTDLANALLEICS